MSRVVAVLGGNAFVTSGQHLTMDGQIQFAHQAMLQLQCLFTDDIELLISHGNGPQVGHILTRVELALGKAYSIPLEVCVAESEGELGYVLELALHNVQARLGKHRPIAALLTRVIVDENDAAFQNPTKPVGVFYSSIQAEELRKQGFAVCEDSGRGFRRVVASPIPREVPELGVIDQLLSMGTIVIAAGGGGIPVVRDGNQIRGVEAVIDKDRTAALMADQLDARLLIILTDVPCAYLNYRSARQTPIPRISPSDANQLIASGHFAPGSMLPKIEAAVQFVNRPGRKAIICDSSSLSKSLLGEAGTTVEYP